MQKLVTLHKLTFKTKVLNKLLLQQQLVAKLVLKLAEEGMSITFISSEIEEMLRTCSRLIVMRDRNIVGELKGEDLTQDRVMRTIAGEGRMETAGVLEKEGA